jgi:hypothetical protein
VPARREASPFQRHWQPVDDTLVPETRARGRIANPGRAHDHGLYNGARHAYLFKQVDEMTEQEGETVLLDKLAGSPLDYVEDEDAPDGALRLREDLLDKRLMMTARFQHKMVDNLAGGQKHRAQAQEFVQSMIDEFRVEVILDS